MSAERPPKWRRDYWAERFVEEVRASGLDQPSRAFLDKYMALTTYCERTLRRIWHNGGPFPGRRPTEATEEVIDTFYDTGGHYAQTHRAYAEAHGPGARSYTTIYRSVRRSLHPRGVAQVRHGARAARRYDVSAQTERRERNDMAEVDWIDLGHAVRGPDGDVIRNQSGHPINLQALVHSDAGCGPIRNLRPAMHKTGELMVAATLETVCGLATDPTFAGIPRGWHDDNDETFQSGLAARLITALVPNVDVPPAWEPRSKPFVESANGLLKQYYSRAVPGYTRGPGDRDGYLFVPLELSPTFPWARDRLAKVVRFVNYELRSRRHGRMTRFERWSASSGAIDIPDPSAYREFLPTTQLNVEGDGVHVGDRPYVSGALAGLGGETVDVHFLAAAEPRVYVSHEGKWLGRAYLRSELPESERRQLDENRRTMGVVDHARRRRWLERAEARAAAMEPTREEDVTPDPFGQLSAAQREQARRVREARKAAARLRGLGQPIEIKKRS